MNHLLAILRRIYSTIATHRDLKRFGGGFIFIRRLFFRRFGGGFIFVRLFLFIIREVQCVNAYAYNTPKFIREVRQSC